MVDLVSDVHVQVYGESKDDSPSLVTFFDLNRFSDETGNFTELLRLVNGNFQTTATGCVNVKQINISELAPNSIKAFHVHKTQTDIIYIPPMSKIKLVVADARVDYKRRIEKYILGDCRSRLVQIPPGIAHGFQNLLDSPGMILYFVDVNFTPNWQIPEFQEYRLPTDYFDDCDNSVWDIPTD